jgi:UDP-glucose 4-epimerase
MGSDSAPHLVGQVGEVGTQPRLGYADRPRCPVLNLREGVSLDVMRDPETDSAIDVRAPLWQLAGCRQVAAGVRLVDARRRQIYGRPKKLPMDEGHSIWLIDINGVSKS